MGVDGQRHAPAALSPGKSPDTHSTGGWVDLRARLDGHAKGKKSHPTAILITLMYKIQVFMKLLFQPLNRLFF